MIKCSNWRGTKWIAAKTRYVCIWLLMTMKIIFIIFLTLLFINLVNFFFLYRLDTWESEQKTWTETVRVLDYHNSRLRTIDSNANVSLKNICESEDLTNFGVFCFYSWVFIFSKIYCIYIRFCQWSRRPGFYPKEFKNGTWYHLA